MLDHMVIMCLNFCGNAILFSIASQSSFTSLLDMKLEKAMAPHSSALAWEIPWTEEPDRIAVHGVAKSRTQLSDFIFTFHFSLSCSGEEMATHSSALAWEIPWTGEPAGLRSIGSQRVGHD